LATVLGLAASSDGATATRGALLSAAYCFGLGVSFLVVGLAFSWAAGALALLRRHTPVVTLIGGTLLAVVGALEVSGLWNQAVEWLQTAVNSSTPAL